MCVPRALLLANLAAVGNAVRMLTIPDTSPEGAIDQRGYAALVETALNASTSGTCCLYVHSKKFEYKSGACGLSAHIRTQLSADACRQLSSGDVCEEIESAEACYAAIMDHIERE